MKSKRTTAFYLETLLLIVVFLIVILVLTRTFGNARRESASARELTNAVLTAQNAAEAVSAPKDIESLSSLLGSEGPARVSEGKVLAERGDYRLEVTWEPEQQPGGSLVSSRITVFLGDGGKAIYELDTAVFLQEERA